MSISQHTQQQELHNLRYTPSTGVQLWDVTLGLVTYSENRGTDDFRISSATSVLGQSPFLSGEGATVLREAGVGLWEQGPQREPSTSSFQKHFSGCAQCLIGQLREMTGTMPCPKVPQGTHSKPLLPSYHCQLSRVVLALLLSGWEPLLVVDICLGVTSPAPLQCKAGCDFQPTACAQDSPTAAAEQGHTGHGRASWHLSKEPVLGPGPRDAVVEEMQPLQGRRTAAVSATACFCHTVLCPRHVAPSAGSRSHPESGDGVE